MINVTKTFLPPLHEYQKYLKQIWKSGWVTNHGPFESELKNKLIEYFKTDNLHLVANGTIALQLAIKVYNFPNDSEIITTPFSYVATTSSIVWEGYRPVFVDIDPQTLTIDANKIENSITDKTVAILATHVYGNPCDVESIDRIAQKYNLKVIYDAAHAFGVKYKNKALVNYGDISTLSFHATKIFHTGEGGAVICKDAKTSAKIGLLRNFGHNGPNNFSSVGINGKMSEIHASLGLSVFPYIKKIIGSRKYSFEYYDRLLMVSNKHYSKQKISQETDYNYSYYPIIFHSNKSLLEVISKLNKFKIYPRRYFYPSLESLTYVDGVKMKYSRNTSERVLCLPLYADMDIGDINMICKIINSVLLKGKY